MFKTTMVYLKAFKAHGAFEMFFRKKNLMFPEMYLESAHTHTPVHPFSHVEQKSNSEINPPVCLQKHFTWFGRSLQRGFHLVFARASVLVKTVFGFILWE